MVSFSCEGCGDVLTKKKLDSHKAQCRGSTFTCLDCMVHFVGTEYRSHTSCISEAQKYQGALYKEKKAKTNGSTSTALVPRNAYVEDEDEDDDYDGAITIVDPPPEAPSPPSAAPGFRTSPVEPVNVFDFYEGAETPNPSTLNLAAMEQRRMIEDTPEPPSNRERKTVWFDDEVVQEDMQEDGALVQYGSGPVPTSAYRTPAPKEGRERKKTRDREPTKEEKKDKKRKRLHVDTSAERSRSREADEVMTDAPPVLHSGLTGGLNRLMSRPFFPPSPDLSGDNVGDLGEASPGSPLKRSKHTKRAREGRRDTISNGIMALITTRKSKKEPNGDRVRKHKRRVREQGEESGAAQKMIEYKPLNGQSENGQQLVLYGASARAELFMSFINKGPESEKGCSMNKTLKRYHRERTAQGLGHGKGHEEKELWRSLRLKKNDRGEIVLFCAEN